MAVVRVAAAQIAAGEDVRENLAACLRVIDAAAGAGAQLVVLPEFCNHLSWYSDRAQARELATRPGDEFLTAIAGRARRHQIWIKINVTHAYAVVRLTGDRAADVLTHECALDLSDRSASDGSAFRTAVSGVAAAVIRDDVDHTRSYLVHCEWSLGSYVFESLLDAGNGWNMEVDGLRITQFVD